MTAREKFQIGDRVRVAVRGGGRRAIYGTVVEPWPKFPTQVRVQRDNGNRSVDGMGYWCIDKDAPESTGARAARSRTARNGDNALHVLVRAAVRSANEIEADAGSDADLRARENLDEAALAFARSLSKADRERLGR